MLEILDCDIDTHYNEAHCFGGTPLKLLALASATLFTLSGLVAIPSVAVAQKSTKARKIEPSQFLGKTVKECEAVLGKASYVEGLGLGRKAAHLHHYRYYKLAGVQRAIVVWDADYKEEDYLPEDKTSIPIKRLSNEIQYVIPKGKAKTWQDAFKLVKVSPGGFKAVEKYDGFVITKLSSKHSAFWVPAGYIPYGTPPDKQNHHLAFRLIDANSQEDSAIARKMPNFSALQSKNVAAYEEVLGKPFSVDRKSWSTPQYPNRNSNYTRNYPMAGQEYVWIRCRDQPAGPVYAVDIKLPPNYSKNWKSALEYVGYSATGITERLGEEGYAELYSQTNILWGEWIPERASGKINTGVGVKNNYRGTILRIYQDTKESVSQPINLPEGARGHDSGNLLKDAKWENWIGEGAAGTVRVDGDTVTITNTAQGKDDWGIQVWKEVPSLRNGSKYTVSFEAKADTDSRFTFVAGMTSPPYLQAGLSKYGVPIGTEWRTFTETFTAENGEQTRLKIPSFQWGKSSGTLSVRNVSLKLAP
jgi:hypothetical protein